MNESIITRRTFAYEVRLETLVLAVNEQYRNFQATNIMQNYLSPIRHVLDGRRKENVCEHLEQTMTTGNVI